MSLVHRDLAWLPRPPADFGARCRALAGSGDGRGLAALSSYALGELHLTRLARLAGEARTSGASLAPLVPFRLAILSNATTSFIAPALVGSGLRHGLALETIETAFDQAVQEALDSRSSLHSAHPDGVLVALDHRGLGLRPVPGDAPAAARAVEAALGRLAMIIDGIRGASPTAAIVLQTVARPPEALFGSLDFRIAGTLRRLIDEFNAQLRPLCERAGCVLLDLAGLAETVGLEAWHDPRQWAIGKMPFAGSLVPLYADHVCRIVAALRGLSRRCLVLDLDNTLWGGVIGDDGLEGIEIGQGSAVAESFLAVQQLALDLRERGIVLAVASKNDDRVARLPFREHPDMVLREDHIAVFQADWQDKASNIEAIADALSLGLSSLVFLDDNPAERELVRQRLPEVAVPELPQDPALYARTLAAAGYFEAVAFSVEDRQRARYYEDNARRLEIKAEAGDLDGYLRSLEMTMTVMPFDAASRPRIAQLIAKSNQFNLTTHRYTEAEVAALAVDPDVFTMQVRLGDKFGDNGMISVVICRKCAAVWEIDTWLMSCRVLKRRVEEAVLREIVERARAEGAEALIGRYIPTARNGMVANHYAGLGFTSIETSSDGSSSWHLPIDRAPDIDLPLRVERRWARGDTVMVG